MKNKPTISSLYVDEDGFLMCGEPGRSTSMVDECRFFVFNINSMYNFDYEVKFINDMNWLCNGYEKKRCKREYLYKD